MSDWMKPDIFPDLSTTEVHVWCAPLSVFLPDKARLRNLLSADELMRAQRFVRPALGDRFIIVHGLLRLLLGRYLGVVPQDLSFDRGIHGKPCLGGDFTRSDLQFNLSDSQDVVFYAMTRDQPLGIDVEWIRPEIDHQAIAQRFFTVGEYQQLMALPPEERMDGFYRCWVRKEAYIKALGRGLSLSLTQFDVCIDAKPRDNYLQQPPNQVEQYRIVALPDWPQYTSALAVRDQKKSISAYILDSLMDFFQIN